MRQGRRYQKLGVRISSVKECATRDCGRRERGGVDLLTSFDMGLQAMVSITCTSPHHLIVTCCGCMRLIGAASEFGPVSEQNAFHAAAVRCSSSTLCTRSTQRCQGQTHCLGIRASLGFSNDGGAEDLGLEQLRDCGCHSVFDVPHDDV